jgi:hypothetical protein
MQATIIELLLHCCSAQPTSVLLLHTLAPPLQQLSLELLQHAGDMHRLLQLHSLSGQLIRVGRDSLLRQAAHLNSARECTKRSHSAAFSSVYSDTEVSNHAVTTPAMQQLLQRIKWDASCGYESTFKSMQHPVSLTETSHLDFLLIGSNMHFAPPNITHMLTPELWSSIPDSCVLSCKELVARCNAIQPFQGLQLPMVFCGFASDALMGLQFGWSFEYMMLGRGRNLDDQNSWPGISVILTQQLRSAEFTEHFIKHICELFASDTRFCGIKPLVLVAFLAIVDAGLSSAMSSQMLMKNVCSNVPPPFPCPSITAHGARLIPIAERARAKLWAAFGVLVSDGDILSHELAAACDRFNATGLHSCIRACQINENGLVASGVIRATAAIFGRNVKEDRLSSGAAHEPIISRWMSVLAALHSMGTLSVTKLMHFIPGIRPHFDYFNRGGIAYIGDRSNDSATSLLQCISPVSCVPQADDKFVLIGSSPLQPRTDVSKILPEIEARTRSSLSPSTTASMTRDLKDYINWRVQFALMPPSRSTLKHALSDLTCKYVQQLVTTRLFLITKNSRLIM